jgi:hypothetical protein
VTSSHVTVRAEGLRRLRADLKQLGDDLGDLKDANARAAQLVATAAAARAPRRTGRLAGSVRGNRAAGRATVVAGRASVPYAGPIHYGWPAHGIEPHPFVIDAAQATEAEWLGLYLEDIDQQLDKLHRSY